MRKLVFFFICLLGISRSIAQDFTVKNYMVDILIHKDGYFDVVESYDVNFDLPKHGIYRRIQTKYELVDSTGNKETRKIRIDKVKVPDRKFDVPFDFVQKLKDHMEIKVGDKHITLLGPQRYQIGYRVYNALLFENSKVRFYWNIKPEDWPVDFHQISFTVRVPDNVYLGEENCFVYSGDEGDTERSVDIRTYFSNGEFSGTSGLDFVSHPGQSVTVLVDLPLGTVQESRPFWPFWTDYGWVFLIGVLLVSYFRVWWSFGKDERIIATTTYYPPDQMDPAMVGFLINDKDDNSDLISLIPYWGARGLIKIEEIPKKNLFGSKDIKLIKLGPLPLDAPDYEREMFEGIFGTSGDTDNPEILVSSLKNTFYTKMSTAKKQLRESAQRYYVEESRKIQWGLYLILIFLAIGLTLIGLFFWGPLAALALVFSCVCLIYLNKFMVRKNAKGNRILSELKGFKRFIKVAEENKLKMLLHDNPRYFETTMGYALAFGMFDQWAKKFDLLGQSPPQWYSATGRTGMANFSKSFSSSMDRARSIMVSAPSRNSSSGGGSSGGGFGGGGGGSW